MVELIVFSCTRLRQLVVVQERRYQLVEHHCTCNTLGFVLECKATVVVHSKSTAFEMFPPVNEMISASRYYICIGVSTILYAPKFYKCTYERSLANILQNVLQ